MATKTLLLLCVLCLTSYNVSGEEGILVSGGTKSPASVEVFIPSSGETCSLPRLLQGGRYSHTMDTLEDRVVVCGGGDYDYSYKTCHSLEGGVWTISHHLAQWRALHNSWVQDDKVILLAGWYSPYTSEVVGEGVEAFPIEHKTSYACSIPDLSTASVIITGGYHYKQIVSRYDSLGFVEDLPSLLSERVSHGCGAYYRDSDGEQVLLVAGGHDNKYPISTHDSTELLVGAASEWVYSVPLPRKIWSLQGVTAGGILYMAGGEAIGDDEDTFLYLDEVFAWQEDRWEVAGKMSAPRVDHAATTIPLDHPALEYCV